MFVLAPVSFAGPDFALSVSPTNIAWDTNTWVNLDITGLTPGQPVDVALYADINRNNAVDAVDNPIMRFRVQDGVTNSLGSQVMVSDTNGAPDGAICARVSYHGLDGVARLWHAVGEYIWLVTSTNGSVSTFKGFTVSQPVGTACITGSVQVVTGFEPLAGTPLPGALVMPQYYSMRQGYVPSTWSDTNGNFLFYLPGGISNDNVRSVSAFAFGYFMSERGPGPSMFLSSVRLPGVLHAGTNSLTQPLYVVPPMSGLVHTLSGHVYDDKTNALAGVLVQMEADDGDDYSVAMTDSSGAFAAPMPNMDEDQVMAYSADPLLNMRGFVGAGVNVGSVSGDTSGIDLYLPTATTLVKGRVLKGEGPDGIMGAEVSISADAIGGSAYAFDDEGRFEIGMVGGAGFEAEVGEDFLMPLRLFCAEESGIELPSSGEWTGLTMRAEAAWVVSGCIYDQDTNALPGRGVTVRLGGDQIDDTEPNLNGYYEFVLPSLDDYQVGTANYSELGYVDQTYPDLIALVSSDVGGVDFYLAEAATISGRVMGEGVPLENMDVQAGLIITNEWGDLEWRHVTTGQTDSNGVYSILVSPGVTYGIGAALDQSVVQTWLGQYFSNSMNLVGATLVTSQIGVPATNINFNLQKAAHISGRVSGGGQPVKNAGVGAAIPYPNEWGGSNWMNVGYSRTDSGGNYVVSVPEGVSYLVVVDGNDGDIWLKQFYSNSLDEAHAILVTPYIDAPATGIDFVLQEGAIISGRVVNGGFPVKGANVQAGLLSPNEWGGWQWQYVSSDNTDSNGEYSLLVPPGIAHAVQISPPDGATWLRQYYSNAMDEAHAPNAKPEV
jgi:hypothetical protein